MTGPEGVFLDRRFLPRRVAKDHVKTRPLTQEDLGKRNGEMQGMETFEVRSRRICGGKRLQVIR